MGHSGRTPWWRRTACATLAASVGFFATGALLPLPSEGPLPGSGWPAGVSFPGAARPAAAESMPQSPRDKNFEHLWTNTSARGGDTSDEQPLSVSFSQVTPSLASLDDHIHFTVTITNDSPATVTNLSFDLATTGAVQDTATARLRMVDGNATFDRSILTDSLSGTTGQLKPGESKTIGFALGLSISAPSGGQDSQEEQGQQGATGDSGASSTSASQASESNKSSESSESSLPRANHTYSANLGFSTAGIYPIALSARGTAASDGASVSGSSRFLLPVQESSSAPSSGSSGSSNPDATPTDADAPTTATDTPRTPLTVILPLASAAPVVPGETGEAPEEAPLLLQNERLTDQLRVGGRLQNLLSAYSDAFTADPALRSASCIAIEPDMLLTIKRMSSGYSIANARPSVVKEKTRLRDSWLSDDDIKTTPGSGQAVAKAWLDKLRETVQGSCVVSLPTAGANLDAVAETKDPWLAAQALSTGDTLIQSVLGVAPQSNIVLPGAGYVKQSSVPVLANAYTNGEPVDVDKMFEDAAKSRDEATSSADAVSTTSTDSKAAGTGLSPLAWPPDDAHVTALVADNALTPTSAAAEESGTTDQPAPSGWGAHVTDLGSGVTAAPFDSDLAATLAGTGSDPETMGFTTPLTRYDEGLDSEQARMQDAIAMLWQSVRSGTPVLAMPPTEWSASGGDAAAFLAAASELLGSSATATPLSAITASRPRTTSTISAPFDDPGVPTDVQILQAAQQSTSITRLTEMMSNDAQIALTRFGFTLPLRTDLLRSLTDDCRHSRRGFDSVTSRTEQVLSKNSDMLRTLLTSVVLVPPGNVYTRMSQSSPILIVARNGLPLPVATTLQWEAEEGVELSQVSQVLPAQGSITLQVHATIPAKRSQTKLKLWLVGDNNRAMSEPVTVAIQSAPGLTWQGVLTVVGIVAAIGVIGYVLRQRRRNM